MNHADKRAEDKNQHFSIIHLATSVLFYLFQISAVSKTSRENACSIRHYDKRELPATKPLDTSRARDH